jgi:hypothetical protein
MLISILCLSLLMCHGVALIHLVLTPMVLQSRIQCRESLLPTETALILFLE